MSQSVKTIVYPVTNLKQSKAIFAVWLGAEPTTDSPYYVGFSVDGQEIGLAPHNPDTKGNGPVNYVNVEDIASSLQALLDAGAVLQEAARDVDGAGTLIASVVDASGNVIGVIQPS